MSIPVLIVGYRRVEELKLLALECLKQDCSHLYIAIDGAKEGQRSLRADFEEVYRNLMLLYPEKEISIWMRDHNLGSAASVITAIDWAFQNEEYLAIIEDDLVISPHLINYWSTNIGKVSGNRLMITGTNAFSQFSVSKSTAITHFPVVWGWATTREQWRLMREGIFSKKLEFPRELNLSLRGFLITGRKRALRGLIDAWDVPLSAWMFAGKYECLMPSVNLVSNIGFGEEATHTVSDSWPLNLEIEALSSLEESWDESKQCRNFDHEMMEMVLGIKPKHAFSKIVDGISTRLKSTNNGLVSLEEKVDSLAIPRSEKP
jgi:hypothetical protein